MVLPLRVLLDERGGEALQLAHTIEISQIGCRLGGLRTELAPGQTITLQRGQQKAPFRVVWSKRLAPNESQAGIEALDYAKDIWGVELPSAPAAGWLTKPSSAKNYSAGYSAAPANSAATVTPLPPIAKTSPSTWSAPRKSTPRAGFLRSRWDLACGLLLLSVVILGLVSYHKYSDGSGKLATHPRVPAPPTAEDLARLTPKRFHLPLSLTAPVAPSDSRLLVAEAPTAHVVYPVAPDAGITGKVRLQIIVAANGLVKQIHLLSGNQMLAQSAADAVRFWHYGSLQGSDLATERETSVTVSFLGSDAVILEFPKAQVRTN